MNNISLDLNLLIDIDDLTSKELNNIQPMNIDIIPWLYERKKGFSNDCYFLEGRGKWMLFFDKNKMNEKWKKSKELFRQEKLEGVEYIKCSTNYKSERASSNDLGLISYYCFDSDNKEKILEIGKKLINLLSYDDMEYIYYKTDMQTKNGCRNSNTSFNYLYKMSNDRYIGDHFIDD